MSLVDRHEMGMLSSVMRALKHMEVHALRRQRPRWRWSAAAVGRCGLSPRNKRAQRPRHGPGGRCLPVLSEVSVGLVHCSERGASRTHAKDVVQTDGEIRHVAAGTGQLDYSFYLPLLRDLEVPLIGHGLQNNTSHRRSRFCGPPRNAPHRKRLPGVGVG